jgi:hypothetical protein
VRVLFLVTIKRRIAEKGPGFDDRLVGHVKGRTPPIFWKGPAISHQMPGKGPVTVEDLSADQINLAFRKLSMACIAGAAEDPPAAAADTAAQSPPAPTATGTGTATDAGKAADELVGDEAPKAGVALDGQEGPTKGLTCHLSAYPL